MRNKLLPLLMVAAMIMLLPRLVHAQTRTCDGLTAPQRQAARAILDSQHPYDCCDGTISECLKQRPVCKLAKRLADDVCRRVAAGQDRASIERALAKRATSMMRTAAPTPIDISNAPAAGVPEAKVTVVAYLCGRCPFCARLTPELHKLVTEGPLKGKAKLHVREFPIRSHEYSTEAAMAMMAAASMGKFWPYVLQLYAGFDTFTPASLVEWAVAKGMDREQFTRLLNDRTLRSRLVASKKEGIRNKVSATPTIFLNGYKYEGDLSVTALQDVIEEEFDRVSGATKE